jgi:tetratricopeptide (TPR) repeat protein/TolB-like protein
MQLLQKRPADRPQSADDVLHALAALNPNAGRNAVAPQYAAPLSAPESWVQAPRRGVAKMIGGAALVVAAAGGMWFYLRHSTNSIEALEVPARVLVVPFENATGDAALTPFGRMAADWVAQGLAHIGSIQVMTEFGKRAANDSGLKSVAIENGARTVVSGTYYLDGDSLRLQTRVTDVGGWTMLGDVPPLSAPRAAPVALLEPLRQRVMAVVAVTRDRRASEWNFGAPPPTYAAYEQFLSGLDLFEAGDWLGGIPYWSRAAALDSAYVQPILHISQAYFNAGSDAAADSVAHLLERRRTTLTPFDRGFLDYIRGLIDGHNGAALEGARAMVRATPGTQLPHLLEAYTAVAANYPQEALREVAKLSYPFGRFRTSWSAQVYWQIVTNALHMLDDHSAELDAARRERKDLPENPEALANELRALAALGRIQEMEPKLEELQVLPVAPQGRSIIALQVSLADELSAHGRPEAAQRLLRRAVAWQHSRPTEERASASSRGDLVAVLIRLGAEVGAQSLVTELLTEQPESGLYLTDQALLLARTGRRQEAAQFTERLRRSARPYDRGRITYARAQIAAQIGDTVEAVTLVRQALAEGMPFGLSLHHDPYFTPLRADPQFQSLRKPRD